MPEAIGQELEAALPLLPDGFGMIRAVLEGRSALGRAWLDDRRAPRAALVGSVEYWMLLGAPGDARFEQELREVVEATLRPGGALRPQDDHVTLVADRPGWEERYGVLFGGRDLLPDPRRHLELAPDDLVDQVLPAGCAARDVDAAFLAEAGSGNAVAVRDWIDTHHESREAYLERCASTVIEREGQPVAWCVTDCRDRDDVAEIGIATDPAHRRRGLAAAAAGRTCGALFELGVRRVGWQAYRRNVASLRTAARVGFRPVRDYLAHFLLFDPAHHERARAWHLLEVEDDAGAALARIEGRLADGVPEPGPWHALAARAAGRLGHVDEAFRHLERALAEGWAGLPREADHADYARLREDPRWPALTAARPG